jgi:hypothetical protein
MSKKRKSIVLIFLLFIVIYISGFYYNKLNACKILESPHFAVAIPLEINKIKGMKNAKCKLFYNNKIEIIESTYFDKEPMIGNRYFVIFNKSDLNYFILFSECPVPDSINNLEKGWSKLPILGYQNTIDNYFNEKTNKGINQLLPSCK